MYSNVFTYDYLWRRIQKVVWTNSGSAWVLSYTNKFVYDGWNVAAILDGTNNVLYSFTWGTDLSGTMQGAGGVGGLVSITYCAPNAGTNAGTYFPCYDGNGNVVALVNAANGSIAANWEYGPFGELIRATGPMAKLTPFMFSTKFYDWETGLYYYGHRYYNPSTGRWLSRDPMEELGGLNLYGYVDNDPSDYVDTDGENRISSPNPHPSPLPGGSRGGPGNQWGGGYNPGRPTAPESESVVAAWISGFWDGIKQAVTTPSYIKCEASCSFDAGLNSFNPKGVNP
jgi:RHS repeat-associated protein